MLPGRRGSLFYVQGILIGPLVTVGQDGPIRVTQLRTGLSKETLNCEKPRPPSEKLDFRVEFAIDETINNANLICFAFCPSIDRQMHARITITARPYPSVHTFYARKLLEKQKKASSLNLTRLRSK